MNVTLSIGVGLNAATYLQDYEYSRIAIEMALGRGGDQVVIKNGDKITYYGGKAQQMEKTTRVKARVKAQALKEFMSTKERVVVMGHKTQMSMHLELPSVSTVQVRHLANRSIS